MVTNAEDIIRILGDEISEVWRNNGLLLKNVVIDINCYRYIPIDIDRCRYQ